MGILNVVAAYMLGVQFGMGMMGVALAAAAVLTLKNMRFTPLYGSAVLGCSNMEFVRPLFVGVMMAVLSKKAGSIEHGLNYYNTYNTIAFKGEKPARQAGQQKLFGN